MQMSFVRALTKQKYVKVSTPVTASYFAKGKDGQRVGKLRQAHRIHSRWA